MFRNLFQNASQNTSLSWDNADAWHHCKNVIKLSLDNVCVIKEQKLRVERKIPMAISREDVQNALEEIRPALQADGGDVELVDVEDDGTVLVRLQGACHGCPMSQLTLSNGVERVIRDRVSDEIRVKNADMPDDFDIQSFFNTYENSDEE